RGDLDFDQIRRLDDFAEFAEVETLGFVADGHGFSRLNRCEQTSRAEARAGNGRKPPCGRRWDRTKKNGKTKRQRTGRQRRGLSREIRRLEVVERQVIT